MEGKIEVVRRKSAERPMDRGCGGLQRWVVNRKMTVLIREWM